MSTPNFERARDYALDRLGRELSPHLTYHSLEHTLKEVSPAAMRLAELEKISDEERLVLMTAVYFHDLGFIRQREGHEAISIQLAEENLPGLGYSQGQIEVIKGIIQATHLPQSPLNRLEMIMADADLDYLGDDDFWRRSNDFRQELDYYGHKFTDEEWYKYQLRFMEHHSYFTETERTLRDSSKGQHIEETRCLLEQTVGIK